MFSVFSFSWIAHSRCSLPLDSLWQCSCLSDFIFPLPLSPLHNLSHLSLRNPPAPHSHSLCYLSILFLCTLLRLNTFSSCFLFLWIDLHVSSDSALSRNQNQDRVADTNPSAVSCRGLDFQFISNCFGTGKLLSTSFLPRGSILYSGVPVEEVCQLSGLLRNEVTLYMTENIISKL